MPDELEGKRAIITAGADGIGRAIARAFMAAGARVHICDIDAAKLAAFQAEAPDIGAGEILEAASHQRPRLVCPDPSEVAQRTTQSPDRRCAP